MRTQTELVLLALVLTVTVPGCNTSALTGPSPKQLEDSLRVAADSYLRGKAAELNANNPGYWGRMSISTCDIRKTTSVTHPYIATVEYSTAAWKRDDVSGAWIPYDMSRRVTGWAFKMAYRDGQWQKVAFDFPDQ